MAAPLLYDFLSTLEGGVNSDLHPSLLPKNVAAWTTNATLRGGYARPRPPRMQRTLVFPSDEVETAVTTGLFQGAGIYRPDAGATQIVISVSGRLFTLTEAGTDWNVVEITITGDPNDANITQCWMNQAEKWLIIADGTSALPIFYDGVSCRRSYGESVVLGQVTAMTDTDPDIGEVVGVTLAAPYTGDYDIPVLLNGEKWQISETSPATGYGASAHQAMLSYPAAYTVNAGQEFNSRPDILGYCWQSVFASQFISGNYFHVGTLYIVTGSNTPAAGLAITIAGLTYYVGSATYLGDSGAQTGGTINGRAYLITASRVALGVAPSPYTGLIYYASTSTPNISFGTLQANTTFNTPDATNGIDLSSLYSGAEGQNAFAADATGELRMFTLYGAGGAPSATVYLENITNTTAVTLPADLLSVPELPAGRMGAYGLGHQAWCLQDGLSFIYGDTVGGPSGTPANDYRDAVLKTTENTFLVGGGSFRVPSSGEFITSMNFTAILDAAYGQGPLQIGTASTIFTCAVPADRATWVALENPILTEALIGKGPAAQDSTQLVNSDTLFSTNDGIGSLIYGRRDFESWGNTLQSTEVNRAIMEDDDTLLIYGSADTFDNRFLTTSLPVADNQGVYHENVLALNLDPVSSLRGKAPSIWESQWTGMNVLKCVTGLFNGVERSFHIALNTALDTLGLYELVRSDSGDYFDDGTARISWSVETPAIFKPEDRESIKTPLVRLNNGKIHLDDIIGVVDITVSFRPDFSDSWTEWISFSVTGPADGSPGERNNIGLGEPPITTCNEQDNTPTRLGRMFMLKFEFTGQCTWLGGAFEAVPEATVQFPPPENCAG